MKGVIFTEFVELVEAKFGADVVDEVIEKAGVSGVYTAVGDYPHIEMLALVKALSQVSGLDPAVLCQVFGGHLLATFLRQHSGFFSSCTDAFSLLESVDSVIHVEVAKLHPGARPPRIWCERDESGRGMRLHYRSHRPFSEVAAGLIEATIAHYGDPIDVIRLGEQPDGTVIFELRRRETEHSE
jgi:hypothetical protein